jgi:hypothetical protein
MTSKSVVEISVYIMQQIYNDIYCVHVLAIYPYGNITKHIEVNKYFGVPRLHTFRTRSFALEKNTLTSQNFSLKDTIF